MKKFTENLKNKGKRLIGLATWILALFLLISTVKNIQRVANIKNTVQKEKDRVEKMKEENTALEAKIAETQSLAYTEKQIRDRLGLVQSGEAIVVLPDESVLKAYAPQAITDEDTLPDPNWLKWKKLFF